MQISVVIPTCNRKTNLRLLLKNLDKGNFRVQEVIVVDSGEDRLKNVEISIFKNLNVKYIESEKSVCIQRNIGIRAAKSEWIFLCDDDIEPPPDYILKLTEYVKQHPEVGAVSGLVLQQEKGKWMSDYPVKSNFDLLFKYIFKLSVWGSIHNNSNNFFIKKINHYFLKKNNHISKAGWPVITNFKGEFFQTPLFGLGASLIKKEWLINAPFDEILDRHGIGDNYGVAAKLPAKIHVVNAAFVYHHHEAANRLHKRVVYYRRLLAIDYFRQSIPSLNFIKKRWLLWSLVGNFCLSVFNGNFFMIRPALKAFIKITLNKNDYIRAAQKNKKVVTPIV